MMVLMKRPVIILVVVVLAVGALYLSGRMDTRLAHVGLNYTTCVQYGAGAILCGSAAKDAQQRMADVGQCIPWISGAAQQGCSPAFEVKPGMAP
jgi:hypothetical protein